MSAFKKIIKHGNGSSSVPRGNIDAGRQVATGDQVFTSGNDNAGGTTWRSGTVATEGTVATSVIYTDESVCRVLGIRRRILGDARTKSSFGRDWAAFREEVGMTREWVRDYALMNGKAVTDFDGECGLEKVSGEYVSCRLVGSCPNRGMCVVEIEAELPRREFCRVRNLDHHPIAYKQVFNAVRVSLDADPHLEWTPKGNGSKF